MTPPPPPVNGSPVVRDGKLRRPVEVAVDELVIRSARGERRLFWRGGDFAPVPWGDRP